jgi:hypothetical protein
MTASGIVEVSSFEENVSKINAGCHIRCTWWEKRNGIYIGERELEVIYLANAESGHTEPARIVSCSLSEFSMAGQVLIISYPAEPPESSKLAVKPVMRPDNEVVKTAKFYLKYPYKWQSYKTKPTYSESFVYFCKTGIYTISEDKAVATCVLPLGSDDDDGFEIDETDGHGFLDECDDSASRVQRGNHEVDRDDLKVGDHIYAYRKMGSYSHHGIYVGPGFGHGEVIHFSSHDCSGTGGKAIAMICSSSLDEFRRDHRLRLVSYNTTGNALTRGETSQRRQSKTASEVVHTAKYYLKNPSKWETYNLRQNNCESFATFCKTGVKITYQGEVRACSKINNLVIISA